MILVYTSEVGLARYWPGIQRQTVRGTSLRVAMGASRGRVRGPFSAGPQCCWVLGGGRCSISADSRNRVTSNCYLASHVAHRCERNGHVRFVAFPLATATCYIPKLTVRVRFPSSAPVNPLVRGSFRNRTGAVRGPCYLKLLLGEVAFEVTRVVLTVGLERRKRRLARLNALGSCRRDWRGTSARELRRASSRCPVLAGSGRSWGSLDNVRISTPPWTSDGYSSRTRSRMGCRRGSSLRPRTDEVASFSSVAGVTNFGRPSGLVRFPQFGCFRCSSGHTRAFLAAERAGLGAFGQALMGSRQAGV